MSRLTLGRHAWRNVLLSSLVLLAAACNSTGSSAGGPASAGSPSSSAAAPSASAPASASALCEDVAALRVSLQKLTSIRPSASTANELKTALQDVQAKLSSLASAASAAGDHWSGQISNLTSALTKLQSAVSTLATQRNASSVSGVVTALAGVGTAARQLLDTASPGCPSSSASPASSA